MTISVNIAAMFPWIVNTDLVPAVMWNGAEVPQGDILLAARDITIIIGRPEVVMMMLTEIRAVLRLRIGVKLGVRRVRIGRRIETLHSPLHEERPFRFHTGRLPRILRVASPVWNRLGRQLVTIIV
jgi:hypothetical protein